MNKTTIKFDDWKRLIDKTSIKCKLVKYSAWCKVYKDTVFHETILCDSYEVIVLNAIENPFIMVTNWPDDNKSFFSFNLDVNRQYFTDILTIDKMKEVVSNLENKYIVSLQAYKCMREDIKSINREYKKYALTKSYEETHAYMRQKEVELNNTLNYLMKIYMI